MWYHVACSDTTNPFLAEARKAGRERFQDTSIDGGGGGGGETGRRFNEPHMLFLSYSLDLRLLPAVPDQRDESPPRVTGASLTRVVRTFSGLHGVGCLLCGHA